MKTEKETSWMAENGEAGLISVIMPTYNREKFILAAVESVFKQEYRPIELVIADDESTDGTEQKVLDWLSETTDPDFKIIYRKKTNGGASSARNWGLRHSRGEFILYLDSDDCLLPGALERGSQLLKGSSLPYAYFRVQISDAELKPKTGQYFGRPFAGNDSDYIDYLWHTMGALFRRSTVCRVGPWSEDLASSDDWEYFTRMKLKGFRGCFDPEVIGLYRDHNESRVVVGSFNAAYVLNTEKACDLIVETAEEQDRLSFTLRKKIAFRLVIHAVEFGMHHHRDDCRRLLDKARRLLPHSPAFQAGISLLKRFSGGMTCNLLWRVNEWRVKAKA